MIKWTQSDEVKWQYMTQKRFTYRTNQIQEIHKFFLKTTEVDLAEHQLHSIVSNSNELIKLLEPFKR